VHLGCYYISNAQLNGKRLRTGIESNEFISHNILRSKQCFFVLSSLDLCYEVLGDFILLNVPIITKRTFRVIQLNRDLLVLWDFDTQRSITNIRGCVPRTAYETLRLVLSISDLRLGPFMHFSL